MSHRIRFIVVGCLFTVMLYSNVASAQLFRRVWDRRKAELRAELSHSLNNKLEADLDREVEVVREKLMATAREQIALESAKLEAQVKSEIANLRKQASAIVTVELQRLSEQTKTQLTKMQAAAGQQIALAAKDLQKQVDTAVIALNRQFAEGSANLRKTIDARLAEMPKVVTAEVSRQVAATVAKQQPEPKPVEKKTSANLQDLKATEIKPVELEAAKDDSSD